MYQPKGNRISDAGVAEIANALKVNQTLEVLYLNVLTLPFLIVLERQPTVFFIIPAKYSPTACFYSTGSSIAAQYLAKKAAIGSK